MIKRRFSIAGKLRLAGSSSWAWLAAVLSLAAGGCSDDTAPLQIANQQRVAEIRQAFAAESAEGDNGSSLPDVEPTGFATFSGRVMLEGDPPANPSLYMDKERDICAPGGQQVFDNYPLVVVGDEGGLANFLIYLETSLPDDPAWIHESARPGREDVVDFDQEYCMFKTPLLAFQTSQTLRVLNSDSTGHNTKGAPSNNLPFNFNLPAHGENSATFSAQERSPFAVTCSIHPWMRAHMICRDNGYFAVTDEDGNFTIPNLPAGIPLEFKLWHEACESRLSQISLDGAAQKLERGGKLVLDPLSADEPERDVEIVIQADQLSK